MNKKVGQSLLETWKRERETDKTTAPLLYYLRFNYEERYVKLCIRLNVEPCGFGSWLRKPVDSII